MEPEYIATSHDSRTAWVTLQENNAIAIVDIRSATVTDVMGLGTKNHSLAGNGLDASNEDDAINITNWPVLGTYMPDAIAAYRTRGRNYLVTPRGTVANKPMTPARRIASPPVIPMTMATASPGWTRPGSGT
jgi:hypothetical protein